MNVSYLVCDWVENHPSCIDGEAYFRPFAVLSDKAQAEYLVADTTRQVKYFEVDRKAALAAYDARRWSEQ